MNLIIRPAYREGAEFLTQLSFDQKPLAFDNPKRVQISLPVSPT